MEQRAARDKTLLGSEDGFLDVFSKLPLGFLREAEQAGLSDLEIISQPVEDENQCLAPPVQLVSVGYRDLPLMALDLSLAGSQLISNADEDENREGEAERREDGGSGTAAIEVKMYVGEESVGFSADST
ncbi:Transmembrane protein 266 [Channa argus]|uniref:Transmembrane protein 266 n=1 Tax=Channa argus TaxID=215402 RepID=A0A6G1P869_CHAAH|nr:Transmembrane protein 266 [Channa argus]